MSYLCSQFKLNLIHEDETVGMLGLWPVQKHPVLMSIPVHGAWDVVSLFWRAKSWKRLLELPQSQLSGYGSKLNLVFTGCLQYFSRIKHRRQSQSKTISGFFSSLTCRLGSGEDKLGGAAALNLSVAGVNVNPINGEGLQARDLQLPISHRLLHELVLWFSVVGEAAVAGRLERGDRAVGVQLRVARSSGVSNTKQISAASIWGPAGENGRKG